MTESLCAPLETEDYVVQSMPDASPAKWHLAHTTWFFEQFVLARGRPAYVPFHPDFAYLFNSYYLQAGPRHSRPQRGLLARPTVSEVYRYRAQVNSELQQLLDAADDQQLTDLGPLIELGLQHEQQHQELLLTDLKHLFASNPLRPAYRPAPVATSAAPVPALRWLEYPERLAHIGHGGGGFAYDNESPRHKVLVPAFQIAARLVTDAEFRAFIEAGGYQHGELWLSDGWATVQTEGWSAPLYWEKRDGHWWHMTLSGMQPVAGAAPVCHVSYYEADAFARWTGARLPTEVEWEVAAEDLPPRGNFLEGGAYEPLPASEQMPGASPGSPAQMFGDVWEWTGSAYLPYPGYRPPAGALGEYNAKFMCNQFVLRGGSCATPGTHIRATYRNFFPPAARWQFTGVRLAKDPA